MEMTCLTLMWENQGREASKQFSHNRLEKVFQGRIKKDFFHRHLENFFKGREKEKVFHSSTAFIRIDFVKKHIHLRRKVLPML